jgi:hypothetical protein
MTHIRVDPHPLIREDRCIGMAFGSRNANRARLFLKPRSLYATGGLIGKPSWYIVGEQGPELRQPSIGDIAHGPTGCGEDA